MRALILAWIAWWRPFPDQTLRGRQLHLVVLGALMGTLGWLTARFRRAPS